MNSTRYGLMATITAFAACGALLSPLPAQGQQEVSQETEVLTRGPVHEAFAETVSFEPEAGILISTQPPDAIDELPPEQELEGDNVTWIAGYWAWDEDINDFIWVSGVWRNVPPDREWVPGYWNETGSQYQWVSGYWADSGTEEVDYLPEPPRSLENGPSIKADSDDDVWIPGTWVWASTNYRWRPGYYQPYRQDWSYVPDRYSWTPRGYVYVNGYWDYAVARRGIIFAPVRFHGGHYRQPNFHYSPVNVININVVVGHLFVRPRYGHYYFGDYYEPRYRDRGLFASVSYYNSRPRGFDPIFVHQRWEHRHDRDWNRRRTDDFEYFRDNRDARPPISFANMRDLGDGRRGFKGRDGKDFAIATPLAVFAKNPEAAGGPKQKFKQLNENARERIVTQRQQMAKFTQERKQIEKSAPMVEKATEGQVAKPTKAKFQRSAIVGKKAAQLSGDQAPPKRKQAPAIAEKPPTPGDDTTQVQPGEDPKQPRRPGRGGRGQGQGEKETMPDDQTPPAKPGDQDTPPKRTPNVDPDRDKVKPQPRPQPEPKEKTETDPDTTPEPGKKKIQPTPGRDRVQPKPQPKQRDTEDQPEPKKVQPQPQPEPKKVQPQPEPRKERVQPEPRKIQPQPEPKKVQPQPRREQVQPQPKKVQPQPQPQPQREKAQPQPQPQRERAQPQPQPQREKAQPQPQPRERQVQPTQPKRQPEGGGRGKGKDKEQQ